MFVCGGRWHDFDYARLGVLTMLGEHEHVRTRVFEDYATNGALPGADVLVTYTCDVRPDPTQQAELADFLARGGRWLALHATNAAIDPPSEPGGRFSASPELGIAHLLGSKFRGHPPIVPYRVEVSDPGHPLIEGIGPFTVSDELYVSEVAGDLDVILHADYVGDCPGFVDARAVIARQPVLYTRSFGEGTVCYFTLGHCRGRFDIQDLGVEDLERVDRGSWSSMEFRTVLSRCVAWVAGGSGV
ncbi:ThuA domain-containing protein [Dietzia lutea]|uniref:ThuA domain-containing protein n=1 Tax=Dietzia lutea TaxID=546160 RepID=UPI001F29175D|nr:ThuA domain-containing protein [Dietzia lutea]